MTGAMHVDMETGLVLNNYSKCVGCWMCAMVCPYGAISQSERKASRKSGSKTAEASTSSNPQYNIVVKCDQCLSEGHDPACVKACPTNAIKFAGVDNFDKSVRREFLTRFTKGEGA
jgi:carbon-monoxide dehydrogenase iron sulfur subunit